MKIKDISGKVYGKLTVIEFSHLDKYHNAMWRCNCECGNETIVSGHNLRKNLTKSCGCLKIEQPKQAFTKHGLRNHPLYSVWSHIRMRCNNTKDGRYKDYGGRGIRVCHEWDTDFKVFYDWAMNNGYTKGLTIDRIDNNGDYQPDNCRWVDMYVQGSNKRNNHVITINGQSKILFEWARIYNISPSLILCRINRGWSEEDAITKPVGKKK